MADSPGLLISFDGVDSSGKATQAKELAERLRFLGKRVSSLQSPDYTSPSGQKLKKLLQQPEVWQKFSWQEKMEFFAANRHQHQKEVVEALKAGEIVVYDRYVASSIAFVTVEALQKDPHASRDDIQRTVAKKEYQDYAMPREHVSVFLDLPVNVTTELLEKRKEKLADKDEYTDHQHVQQALYNEYDLLCQADPQRFMRISCLSGTEVLPIADVAELVWQDLIIRFPNLVHE